MVYIVSDALHRRYRRSIDTVHHTVECALCLSMAVVGHRRLYKVPVNSHCRPWNIVQAIHRHPLWSVTIGYTEGLPNAAGQTLRWGKESLRIHCRRRRLQTAPVYVFYRVSHGKADYRYTLLATWYFRILGNRQIESWEIWCLKVFKPWTIPGIKNKKDVVGTVDPTNCESMEIPAAIDCIRCLSIAIAVWIGQAIHHWPFLF